jgi:hypothetical protein
MEALVRPVAENVAQPDNHYVGFLDRWYGGAANYGEPLVPNPEAPGMARLAKLLHVCLPQLPPDVVEQRVAIVIRWMVQTLATYERSVLAAVEVPPLETAVQNLIDMLAEAMSAPVSATTRRSRREQPIRPQPNRVPGGAADA